MRRVKNIKQNDNYYKTCARVIFPVIGWVFFYTPSAKARQKKILISRQTQVLTQKLNEI